MLFMNKRLIKIMSQDTFPKRKIIFLALYCMGELIILKKQYKVLYM